MVEVMRSLERHWRLVLSMNMGCFTITEILSDFFQLFFIILQRTRKNIFTKNKQTKKEHVTMDQNVEYKQKTF